ncbi:RNA-binding protein 28 isoform X2 [Boleophthalmus pectinirostris]|uniref:RNA-binding protein 28 isoform X2 n=1 Tax=Boleophthalmus pectinirostris TaxID=150288 RepID=UPI00242B9E68|nr:RNA-binding protein 28 isoform X2 [Boleophthalmus pectinirostris]
MPAPTIFVQSLPATATNERLGEIFSEIGPIKQCFVVKEKGTDKCRGFGYVTYSLDEDAQRALKEVKDYDGQRLSLTTAKKKIRDKKKAAPEKEPKEKKDKGFKKSKLKARLIIRNLSFKCSEDDLRETFAKFGTVLEARIPLKPDGKMRGFAFVLFKNVSEAAKALTAMNMKEIKGRPVAVDWAVAKDKYLSTQPASSTGNNKEQEATTEELETNSNSEEDTDVQKPPVKERKKPTSAKAKVVEQSDDSSEEEDGDEEDCEEEEEDTEEEEEEEKSESEDSALEGDEDEDDEEDDDNEDEDDENDDDDDDVDLKKKKKKNKSKKALPSDINEGRTIFIRNLSFDTEEEGLEEVLLQYGELNYIKIVLHPDTEHSKGCAFAQFKTKEAAEKCIAAAQDEAQNGGIRVDGRKLLIVAAVTREEASKLKDNKKKVETGTRNLYLAREGLIRAGTKAAEGIPEADMAKRTRFEEIKRAKLKDIHVFVSKTRLCVHNLPKSVDTKRLKSICLQGLKGTKGVRISECRVMYDKKPEKGQIMGQSLGYGFVQFSVHEHALSTLRYLNNNPNIFGPNKRPIVEFSLEDSRKLQIKEARKQHNRVQTQPAQHGGKQVVKKEVTQSHPPSDHTGKEKAPVQQQQQKQNRYFSGFQTRPEVEHVDLENGKKRRKVLPMPSHRGPKIRMRDKGKQVAPAPKKARAGPSRKEMKRQHMEKPTHTRNQVKPSKPFKRKGGDRFDSLVEQYKRKLMGTTDSMVKRSKWFDS